VLEKPDPSPHASSPKKPHEHIVLENTKRTTTGDAVTTSVCISCGDHL
jgi:hypothetical protein